MASKQVGDLVVRLQAQTERFNAELEKARATNRRFERQAQASHRAVAGMGSALRGLLPALGTAALVNYTRRVIQMGDAMSKQARILGLTVEEFSALQFASKQAGVEQEALFKAVKTFGDLAGEAALKGTGELVQALGVLGVSLRDNVTGQVKPTSQLLAEFARELNRVEDPMLKISLAADAFGARGVAIINLLPELAGGFDSVKRSAAAAGVLIDDATGAALERAQNRIDVFTTKVSNLAILFGGQLIQIIDPDTEEQIRRVVKELGQLQETYQAAVERGTDPEGLQRIADAYTFAQGRYNDLLRAKEKNEELDKRSVTSAETLLERYLELEKIGERTAAKRSAAGAGSGVLRNFELGPIGGGRSVPSRRGKSALDYGIDLGPVEGQFRSFRTELTDTQQVIVDSTRSTMGAFTSEIGSALTDAEFRFDRFAASVAQSIASIVTQQITTALIVKPLFSALGITASAAGNVFSGGRVQQFALGGVLDGPTVFPLANGIGLAGEAGPEGILPLARNSRGELGVKSSGGGSGVFAPSITINMNAGGSNDSRTPTLIAGEVKRALETFWRGQFMRESRTGGVLNPLA